MVKIIKLHQLKSIMVNNKLTTYTMLDNKKIIYKI
jgi:hypothetical protein